MRNLLNSSRSISSSFFFFFFFFFSFLTPRKHFYQSLLMIFLIINQLIIQTILSQEIVECFTKQFGFWAVSFSRQSVQKFRLILSEV